jgi:hypothetical protein
MVQIGGNHWLRIPLGKLRNDRYVPLHPQLVELLTEWTAANLEHIRAHRGLVADHRGPVNRHSISRIIHRIGRAAGVPGVHPHRLRHTLATQAINRGMRLEPIAALLGHKKMEMTLIYARIANRVVADEYAAVSAKIDALYGQQPELPADYETTGMARLRRETHARMLGNGLCTRPVELDCRMESACETCAYFRTNVQFLPPSPSNATTPENADRPNERHCSTASSDASKPKKATTMPDINLELGDAVELAELLTFLPDWLSSSQRQTLAHSLTAYVGHDRYTIDKLHNDLHRFVCTRHVRHDPPGEAGHPTGPPGSGQGPRGRRPPAGPDPGGCAAGQPRLDPLRD